MAAILVNEGLENFQREQQIKRIRERGLTSYELSSPTYLKSVGINPDEYVSEIVDKSITQEQPSKYYALMTTASGEKVYRFASTNQVSGSVSVKETFYNPRLILKKGDNSVSGLAIGQDFTLVRDNVLSKPPSSESSLGVYDLAKQQTMAATPFETLAVNSLADRGMSGFQKDNNIDLFSKDNSFVYFKPEGIIYKTNYNKVEESFKSNVKKTFFGKVKDYIKQDRIRYEEIEKERQRKAFEGKDLLSFLQRDYTTQEFQAKNREKVKSIIRPVTTKVRDTIFSITDKDYDNYVKSIESSQKRQERFFKDNQGIKNIRNFSKLITFGGNKKERGFVGKLSEDTVFNLLSSTPVVSVPSLISSGENLLLTTEGLFYRETSSNVSKEFIRAGSEAIQVYREPSTYTTAFIFAGLSTGNVLNYKYGTPPPKSSGVRIGYESFKIRNMFTDKSGSIRGKSPISKAGLRRRTEYQNLGKTTIQSRTGKGLTFSNKERAQLYIDAQKQLRTLNSQQNQQINIKGNVNKITTFRGKDKILIKQGRTVVGKANVRALPKQQDFVGIKQNNINTNVNNNQVTIGLLKTKNGKIVKTKVQVSQLSKPSKSSLNQFKQEQTLITKQKNIVINKQQEQGFIQQSVSKSGGRERVRAQIMEKLRLKKLKLDETRKTQIPVVKESYPVTDRVASGREVLVVTETEYKPTINLKTYSSQGSIKTIKVTDNVLLNNIYPPQTILSNKGSSNNIIKNNTGVKSNNIINNEISVRNNNINKKDISIFTIRGIVNDERTNVVNPQDTNTTQKRKQTSLVDNQFDNIYSQLETSPISSQNNITNQNDRRRRDIIPSIINNRFQGSSNNRNDRFDNISKIPKPFKKIKFNDKKNNFMSKTPKKTQFKSKYLASVEASFLNIKGNKPSFKSLSAGLNIRPITR